MMRLLFSTAFALFAGCAAQSEETVSDATPAPCERVYRVGSHMPTRDCVTPPTDAQRQRTIDALRDATKVGAKPAGGGG